MKDLFHFFLICFFRELFVHEAILFVHEIAAEEAILASDAAVEEPRRSAIDTVAGIKKSEATLALDALVASLAFFAKRTIDQVF